MIDIVQPEIDVRRTSTWHYHHCLDFKLVLQTCKIHWPWSRIEMMRSSIPAKGITNLSFLSIAIPCAPALMTKRPSSAAFVFLLRKCCVEKRKTLDHQSDLLPARLIGTCR